MSPVGPDGALGPATAPAAYRRIGTNYAPIDATGQLVPTIHAFGMRMFNADGSEAERRGCVTSR